MHKKINSLRTSDSELQTQFLPTRNFIKFQITFKFPITAAAPAQETSAPRRAECGVAIAKEFVKDRSPCILLDMTELTDICR